MNDSQGRVGISMNAAHDPSLLHASSATPTGSSPMSNPEMTRQMMTRGASLDAADLDALLNGSDFPSSSLMPNSLARSSTETDLGFEQNHTQNHLPLGREVVWETQGDLDHICSLQKSTQGHQKYMGMNLEGVQTQKTDCVM
jgi:hypothetical protein